VAGLTAGILLAVSGCGSSDDAAPRKRPSDPVAQAARRVEAAGGARISGRSVFSVGGRDIVVPVSGTADFAHHRMRLSFGLPTRGATVRRAFRKQGFPYEEVYGGTLVWHRSAAVERALPGAKQWILVDRARIGDALGIDVRHSVDIDTRNPAKFAPYLRTFGGLRKVAAERVGGVATTHYSARLDTRRALRRNAKSRAAAANVDRVMQITELPDVMPIDLWLDGRGLIRRQRVALDVGQVHSVVTEDYSGYSRTVTVPTPPADEVLDVTAQTAREVKRRLGP
jgi:hypothetical protein